MLSSLEIGNIKPITIKLSIYEDDQGYHYINGHMYNT